MWLHLGRTHEFVLEVAISSNTLMEFEVTHICVPLAWSLDVPVFREGPPVVRAHLDEQALQSTSGATVARGVELEEREGNLTEHLVDDGEGLRRWRLEVGVQILALLSKLWSSSIRASIKSARSRMSKLPFCSRQLSTFNFFNCFFKSRIRSLALALISAFGFARHRSFFHCGEPSAFLIWELGASAWFIIFHHSGPPKYSIPKHRLECCGGDVRAKSAKGAKNAPFSLTPKHI